MSLLCDAYAVMELFSEAGIYLEEGKIRFPEGTERVKIDVGLSVNAPQSQYWIASDSHVFVLGIEPLIANLDKVRSGSSTWKLKLSPNFVGKRIALIRTALFSKHIPGGMAMYVTKADPGCSSLHQPKSFDVDYTETVPVYSLDDILDYFPFDQIPLIDHLKIDAQGADYEIVKGVSKYLDRIFAITVGQDTDQYHDSTNSIDEISKFFSENNFIRVKSGILAHLIFLFKGYKIDVETEDPTFINLDKIKASRYRRFFLYQRG